VAEALSLLALHLTKAGIRVLGDTAVARAAACEALEEHALADTADLVVAIGGDGTMLYAADLVRGKDKPLLGVNRGRLGFLADVSPSDMLESIDRVLAGQYSVESRLLLAAAIRGSDGEATLTMALNDVVLQRRETGRMVDFETRIDGGYINTHAGDGLIVATPTGSTAYSLSCGGPIVEPGLDAVVLVPICPHTLSDRPIVIPASRTIEVTLLERDSTKAEVVIDGRSVGELTPDDRLTISASDERLTLIHPPGYDYYDILRTKLHWGHDGRMRVGTQAEES
jgi:NAD+ kinase